MKLGTDETCLICTQVQDILQLSTIQWFSVLFQEQLMLCVCMYNVMKMVPKFLTLHTQNPDWSEVFKQLFQREDFVSIQKELRFLDSLIQGNNFSSELLGARNNFTSHWAASDQFLIQNVLVSSALTQIPGNDFSCVQHLPGCARVAETQLLQHQARGRGRDREYLNIQQKPFISR